MNYEVRLGKLTVAAFSDIEDAYQWAGMRNGWIDAQEFLGTYSFKLSRYTVEEVEK